MSEELLLKSKKISETEKLYADLRKILLKQPGPEFIQDLAKTKTLIKNRDEKIKVHIKILLFIIKYI